MFATLVLCLSSVVILTYAEPCKNNYTASMYIGRLRVPVNCTVEPVSCPRSWKSGIPDGKTTGLPLIYTQFLTCHEGFTKCGYVPLNPKTGEVLGKSGVTFGAGVDLGSKSQNYSAFRSLPQNITDKLAPYFGLQQAFAACAIIENPLGLAREEAENVTVAVKEYTAMEVGLRYDNDRKHNTKYFSALPRGIRTAIVSVWFQFGEPKAYPKFWSHVVKNDWSAAVGELRSFYTRPEIQQKGDLRRRNNEADIIEATFVKCQRSLDVVFLLDDSGSVSDSSFDKSLDFVLDLITAFPDKQLQGSDGTRFGLAKFNDYYSDRFYLSQYSSHSEYKTAIAQIPRSRGTTYLGGALQYVLDRQFRTDRGLRKANRGIPRVLIVLTDGKSHDVVAGSAKRIHDKYIVVYAVGIGDYDLTQLYQIASTASHVYTLSNFFQLETFIATLTAATCNEAQPIALWTQVKSVAKPGRYQYFLFRIDQYKNLELTIDDLSGKTIVYVSLSNPHPYGYDADIAFKMYRKDKTIVISPRNPNQIRVYVSVTTSSSSALFTIEGSTCDPSQCREGTNEPRIVALNQTVTSKTKKSVYQYFIFNVNLNLNLEITVQDLSGKTLVYASRSNPLPNKADNDFIFDSTREKMKLFVLSPRHVAKRATNSQKELYISVTTNTANAVFNITGVTCDPANCTETRIFAEITTQPTHPKSASVNIGKFGHYITVVIVTFSLFLSF